MCDAKKNCEKPVQLKSKPQECIAEQINICHADVKAHPCISTKECHDDVKVRPCA